MRTRTKRVFSATVAATFVLALAAQAAAQTGYIPYFGKNRIKYDSFDWHIYDSEHFEIYYYPEIEQHLERVAGYAESAYQKISSDLKHDLAFKVPLVIFKTQSEFQQQNVMPGEIPEGVAAFAEPQRDRMVLPIDEPPDQLYRLITHELTHIFEFDIIPRSLIRQTVPLWVDEGLADYMAGDWRPLDLMTVRDAAVADIIPKMSDLEGYGSFNNPRLIYNLGHVAFEFIEDRWGKEGIRQYMFSLRKTVIGGGDNAYQEAFKISADEFDEQFEKYVKDRFKPFRDKERPADYGRNLAPRPDKTKYTSVLSIEPSPSGDLLAAVAGNRKDRELDIILISTKDGEVIRSLTSGFDKDMGFEYIALPGARWNAVPWMGWAPTGDRLAFFARTEKQRSLIIENVVTEKVEQRFELRTVDAPESPSFSPDGKLIAFSALQGAVGDIWILNLETEQLENITKDDFADYAPTFSPDGKFLIYMARISGNDKLFKFDFATKEKTQLTFGTHDDATARFMDIDTIVFASTASDPSKPADPEVARNGNIFNVWTLNMKTGELRQYTDTLTGNVSPVVLKEGDRSRIVFVTYFKGEYGVHSMEPKEPIATAATSDFGAPGPVIDFQAPLTHTLVKSNERKKGRFEKMFLEGRPPVALGVTSGGDVFGGTQVTFSDVLGDRQFNFFASSVSQYRTFVLSYTNLANRVQYAAQGFSQTEFFYGLDPSLIDPGYGFLDRDAAVAQRTMHGGSVFAIYPFNRYRRLEVFGGLNKYSEEYEDPFLQQEAEEYQIATYGRTLFYDGFTMPMGAAFVQETTVFREFGPLAGNTVRLSYEVAPPIGDMLSRQTVDGDARYYLRLGGSGLLALRARGYKSWGEAPSFFYFGGNSEMRGYDYLSFIGDNGWYGNAELRFPLIDAMATPIGILGGIRGAFFFNIGGAWYDDAPFNFYTDQPEVYRPIVDYRLNLATNGFDPVYGPAENITGFRLRDGRASYGVSLETFALGFPVHFDWSWRTLFNEQWEDALFAYEGGSSEFRQVKFSMWIGYDF